MKKSVAAFLTLVLSSAAVHGAPWMREKEADPAVVATVDLQRYAGTWFEIAHAPNFFQRGCVRSTAEYAVIDAATVSVRNVCIKENGSTRDIRGQATVTNANEPAKLKVRFNIFAKGDYWIVDLDQDYQWAVVSAPEKKSLFILARKAPMAQSQLREILDRLESRGFKTDDLIYDRY